MVKIEQNSISLAIKIAENQKKKKITESDGQSYDMASTVKYTAGLTKLVFQQILA